MITIPLRISGVDANNQRFTEDGRTIMINRNGARIIMTRPLASGRVLHMTNLISQREADFRVVGPLTPATEKGGEWGVECLEPGEDIWAIQFPPPPEGQAAESKALLECRECHSVVLMSTSLVEVEVLEASGIISRRCPSCGYTTPFGYAEKQVAMSVPSDVNAMVGEAKARATASGKEQRRHRRVALQLPVLIRDYYGAVEVTKTENVSKGGFCFGSDKEYFLGQGVMVVCPYNPNSSNIETRARVVRRQEIAGTTRKLYGVRYMTEGS
jgi:hypothetical protein